MKKISYIIFALFFITLISSQTPIVRLNQTTNITVDSEDYPIVILSGDGGNGGASVGNCSVLGSCSPTVAYMDYANEKNFNISGNSTSEDVFILNASPETWAIPHVASDGSGRLLFDADSLRYNPSANILHVDGTFSPSLLHVTGTATFDSFLQSGVTQVTIPQMKTAYDFSQNTDVFFWSNQSYLNETDLALSINTTANLQNLLNDTGIYINCNTSGSCSDGGVCYLNITNAGNITVSQSINAENIYSTDDIRADDRIIAGGRILGGENAQFTSGANFKPQFKFIHAGNTSSSAPSILQQRARGGTSTPTAVQDGDKIGQVIFYGHEGSAYKTGANIEANVDGTPVANHVPTELLFKTDNGVSSTPKLTIRPTGTIVMTSLSGSYTNGEAYVCVYDNGTIFAKDSACS